MSSDEPQLSRVRATFAAALADRLADGDAIELLAKHWLLVYQWNERTNLTAISATEEAALLHYRDSLELLQVLVPGDVVDIGSGGGFPGVPIAVACRDRKVTLLEPRRKRCSFLRTVRAELGLTNIDVLEGRVEQLPTDWRGVANAVTRATFSDAARLADCAKWLSPGGRVVAMRSAADADGNAELHRYVLGGVERCLEIHGGP